MIIASEMAAPLRISSGPAITHAGDLAAILSGLVEGEVFFLDEIHRMSRPAEEMLYLAMEDFRVDVIVGRGAGRHGDPSEIPRFTWSADHPRGSAARPVARPLRFHRPPGLLRHQCLGAILHRSPGSWRPEWTPLVRRDRHADHGGRRDTPTGCCAVRDFAQVQADGRVLTDPWPGGPWAHEVE